MKQWYLTISLLAATLVLASCSFEEPEAFDSFVIIDEATGQSLSTYNYDKTTKDLAQTVTYDETGRIMRTRSYSFDSRGYVEQITEVKRDGSEQTIRYSTKEILDAQGRIEKVETTSSQGEVVQNLYGYDETGKLRGTVVISPDGRSVMMKDYDDAQ